MKPADYLKAIRRRWGDIALAVVVALGAGGLISALAPAGPVTPEYRASAILISGTDSSEKMNLKTVAALVQFRDVAQRAATKLGYAGDPGELALDVAAAVDEEAGILRISMTSESPTTAVRVANAFAQELVGFLEQQQAANLASEAALVQGQINKLKREITALGQKIAVTIGPSGDILRSESNAKVAQLQLLFQTSQRLAIASVPASSLQILPAPAASTVADTGFQAPRSFRSRMIVAGLLGLIAGIVIVLMIERLDTRIRTKRDAEKGFGLPVLAEIPFVPRNRRRADGLYADAYRVLGALLALKRPGEKQQPAEGNGGGNAGRAILVTSPGPGDGKTTVVANLAATFGEKGKDVLVLSCDFRRPRIHELFGSSNVDGLALRLSGENGGGPLFPVFRTSVHNVHLVPSGPPPERPGQLLASEQMRAAIQEARGRADVVILDTAPILTTSDAAPLMGEVDAVLVVARAGRTTSEVAERTTDLLKGLHAPVVGVALNAAAEIAVPRRYYGAYAYSRGDKGAGPNGNGSRGFSRLLSPFRTR